MASVVFGYKAFDSEARSKARARGQDPGTWQKDETSHESLHGSQEAPKLGQGRGPRGQVWDLTVSGAENGKTFKKGSKNSDGLMEGEPKNAQRPPGKHQEALRAGSYTEGQEDDSKGP